MASQFGFCNNCGAPRSTDAAGFCASCGTSLPAVAAALGAVPPPPPTQAWGAAPPPPPPPAQQPWGAPQQQGWNSAPQQGWVAPSPQPWSGTPTAQKKGLSPIVIVGAIILVAALAVGGFFALSGNKGGTATGSGGPTAGATTKPGTTVKPGATAAVGTAGSGGNGLTGASAAFENINSFQFKMTLAGGTYGDMLSMFGGSSGTGSAPFTMSGIIVLKPQKAADINMGTFHIIEVGGYDYVDMGLGSYVKQAVTGSTSMADSFSPETMFSSMVGASSTSDYGSLGTEDKNGVKAVHYQATTAALNGLGSSLGVAGATWSSDVWISADGGYPVSFSVIGTAADKSLAYEVSFDISNVNDAGNNVTAPTNVMGG